METSILAITASAIDSLFALPVVPRAQNDGSLGGFVYTAMGVIRRVLINFGSLMSSCLILLGFDCLTRTISSVASFIEGG